MSLCSTPLTIGRAAHTEWPKPDYILGPLQAGDIGLLSGADGSGKSLTALAAAASVAYGKPLLGGIWDVPPGVTGRTLCIFIEDREADHGRRLQALAAYCAAVRELPAMPDEEDDAVTVWAMQGQRVPLVQRSGDGYALTPLAEEFAKGIADYQLVVLDPLRAFHNLDESDGAGLDFLARWLVTVAMCNQQVHLLVHHASQDAILNRRSDHHAGRGATDLPAACRAVWVLRAPTEIEVPDEELRRDVRVLVNGKASHAAEGATRFLRRVPVAGSAVFMRIEPPEAKEEKYTKAARKASKAKAYAMASNGGYDDDNDFF
jgi:RecA-family ATPase